MARSRACARLRMCRSPAGSGSAGGRTFSRIESARQFAVNSMISLRTPAQVSLEVLVRLRVGARRVIEEQIIEFVHGPPFASRARGRQVRLRRYSVGVCLVSLRKT